MNNNYAEDFQIGTVVILDCNEGYRVKGETTSTCNRNGWTPLGTCVPTDGNVRENSQ